MFHFLGISRGREPLAVGSRAPKVSVQDQEGHLLNVEDLCRTGFTLIYFYPKADTPGCTAQACSLRDQMADLTREGVRIYGVSRDSMTGQKRFQEKYKLPFPLLADVEGKVTESFGVPIVFGFPSRQTFLFKNGILVWRAIGADTSRHADEVLIAVRQLN